MQTNFIKINQSDLRKLRRKINNLRVFDSKTLSNELGKTGFEIVSLAKRNVVIDKGSLKQSIGLQKSGKSITVFANANYAPYVEFGTGGSVDLNDMLELGISSSYAAQFKGKGIREVNLPPRPFFFSSARIGFRNLLIRLNKQIKKTIK